MKLSFEWLSEFVDLSGLTAQEVAERLTMGAFEVEEITLVGPDLIGPIVVGEIVEIHQHPNADKIRLTKTRIKAGAEPIDIVCGAGNIEVGQLIPVALPGAKVINRHDGSALLIKASAIRGVHSNGMLCSPPELGIAGSAQAEGILILNEGSNGKPLPELGSDILQILPLKRDFVLHVEPRSNRGDALSVLGLAREVAALFGRPLKHAAWSLNEAKCAAVSNFDQAIIDSEKADSEKVDPEKMDCPFITLRVIERIKIAPSHPHIASRLEAIGMRTVNNVVDITNYVMHELGQPLHAYDAAKIKNKALSVRRARSGETIETIDAKERKLTEEMLVIADGDTVVGVAGVMGGKESEIGEETTALILEAACFAPAVVRRASRQLGLSSDASLRFERGVDPASVSQAACRAAYLIAKYCGQDNQAVVLGPLLQAGYDQVQLNTLTLRSSQIKRLLGLEVSAERVSELLTPLGFTVSGSGEKIQVVVPSFRKNDVQREIDLIEEVCRLNGYDKIASAMPAATMAVSVPDDTLQLAREILTGHGLSEAWLSSLVPLSQETNRHLSVQVLNPLSKDHQLMRQSLIPGLVSACSYNQNHGRKDVWLFEYGRVYFKDMEKVSEPKTADGKASTGVKENNHLAGLICGQRFKSFNKTALEVDFYLLKGVVENLLSVLNIDQRKLVWKPVAEHDLYPWLHPGKSAVLTLNRPAKPNKNSSEPLEKSSSEQANNLFESNITLGYVGELHPRYADACSVRDQAFIFELDLDRLKKERKQPKFSGISNGPEIVRDITADFDVTDKEVQYEHVSRLIWKHGGQNLQGVELVSIYKPSAESKQMAMTCRLSFQHASETITSEEIDKVLTAIRESLNRDLSASFRL